MALIDKETIRKEIERRLSWRITLEARAAYNNILRFLNTLPEQPVEGLEEAAREYADKHGFRVPYDGSNNFYDDVDVNASKEGFIAGAEWKKAKMLEKAVEGEVVQDLQGVNRVKSFGKVPKWLHFGDKVKIIIIKEDQK